MEPLKKFALVYYFLIITNIIIGGIYAFNTKDIIFGVTLGVFNIIFLIGTILFTSKRSIVGFYIIIVLFSLSIVGSLFTLNYIMIIVFALLIFDLAKNGKKLVS